MNTASAVSFVAGFGIVLTLIVLVLMTAFIFSSPVWSSAKGRRRQ